MMREPARVHIGSVMEIRINLAHVSFGTLISRVGFTESGGMQILK